MVIVTHLLKIPKPLHCTLWTVTGKWQLDFSLIRYFFQWEWVDGRNTIQRLWWCCFWPELPGSANDLLHFGSLKIWDFWHFLRAAKPSGYISWESFLHSFNPPPLLIHLGIPVSHFSQWSRYRDLYCNSAKPQAHWSRALICMSPWL